MITALGRLALLSTSRAKIGAAAGSKAPLSSIPGGLRSAVAIMAAKLVPQRPDEVMVIRDVTPRITTFSLPFARFGILNIGGRGTVVKLSSGALAVFSPVALTPAVEDKVAHMGGKVGYIVALDVEHHLFISEWARRYPGAKIIGPEGLAQKRAQQDNPMVGKEKFDVVFTSTAKHQVCISGEFDADFDYEYVDGHANRELVFLYRPDRVLIEADLLFNLPAHEQYSRVPEAERPPAGLLDRIFRAIQGTQGDVVWARRMSWYLLAKNRSSFNASVRRIDSWEFTTLIPCHGDVLESDAQAIFRKVFAWHLEAKLS